VGGGCPGHQSALSAAGLWAVQQVFGWIDCAGGRCSGWQEANALAKAPLIAAIGVEGISFKAGHYGARLIAEGLDVGKVEAAVADEIAALGDSLSPDAPFWGRLTVDGVLVEYRAFPLPGGGVNVGTLFPVR
jgi:hypothetical protein